MEIYSILWKFCGNLWKCIIIIYSILWKFCGNLWKFMEMYSIYSIL
jgi:hypothetical protein